MSPMPCDVPGRLESDDDRGGVVRSLEAHAQPRRTPRGWSPRHEKSRHRGAQRRSTLAAAAASAACRHGRSLPRPPNYCVQQNEPANQRRAQLAQHAHARGLKRRKSRQ